MNKRKTFALNLALLASLHFSGIASAQNYPYAPGYNPGPSPLVSEDQLQSLGCGLIDRNMERGTLNYECPIEALNQIQESNSSDGPRCTFTGQNYQTGVARFQCRENVVDYDRDQPRYGRDYGLIPRHRYNR